MTHPIPTGDFHIVVLDTGLWLVRAPGGDWRLLQARFPGFKTCLGPADLEETLDLLFAQWPSLSWREAEVRLWACSADADTFDLEAPRAAD